MREGLLRLRQRAALEVEALKARRMRGEVDPWDGDFLRDLTLAYRGAGDEVGARITYPQACTSARRRKDDGLLLSLVRMTRLFLNPDSAESHLRWARELAREKGFCGEEARCLNDLGVVALELRNFPLAHERLLASLGVFGALGENEETAVPLMNLACLGFARGDLAEARERLAVARVCAAGNLSRVLAIRLLQAILRAVEEKDFLGCLDELQEIAKEAPASDDLETLLALGFALGRAYLLRGNPRSALDVALPPPRWGNDDALAYGALAALSLEAWETMDVAPLPETLEEAEALSRTTSLQAWRYRQTWVPRLVLSIDIPVRP
ncbi:MAG TPA: hypothetical protein VEL74_22855 [Thermoanaerobaculia bacterium]|nr:hypothetical protein [Thermoanaerobaculia bacterium]